MYGDAKQLSEITLLAFLTYRNSISAVSQTRRNSRLEIFLYFDNNSKPWVGWVRENAFSRSIIYEIEKM